VAQGLVDGVVRVLRLGMFYARAIYLNFHSEQSHQHYDKLQIEHKYKTQKTSQDKRTQDMAPARDKPHNVWANPLIKSYFIFKVQQRKKERER